MISLVDTLLTLGDVPSNHSVSEGFIMRCELAKRCCINLREKIYHWLCMRTLKLRLKLVQIKSDWKAFKWIP